MAESPDNRTTLRCPERETYERADDLVHKMATVPTRAIDAASATIIKIPRHEMAYSVMAARDDRGAACEHVGDIAE
jgi:hypothetical protein